MFTPPPSIFTIWFIQFIHINKKNLLWQSKWADKCINRWELFWEFSQIVIHLSPCSNGTAETRWGKSPQPNRPLPLNDSVQSYSNCNYEGEISWSSSDEISHWIYDLRYHYSSRKSTAISAGIKIFYSVMWWTGFCIQCWTRCIGIAL